jgi:hypothetical protein
VLTVADLNGSRWSSPIHSLTTGGCMTTICTKIEARYGIESSHI